MMKQYDRLFKALQHLEEHEMLNVEDICKLFGVSRDTARRDILELEKTGAVERCRGGVRRPVLRQQVESYKFRQITNAAEKRALGLIAAGMVKDCDTVMLDLSTTVQYVAEALVGRNILAVTHSLDNAQILSQEGPGQVYITGGYCNYNFRGMIGACVAEKIQDFRYDIAFIGVAAVDERGGYCFREDDIAIKRAIRKAADKVVLVVDESKFEACAPNRLNFSEIDILLTDKAPGEPIQKALEAAGVRIMVASDGGKRGHGNG